MKSKNKYHFDVKNCRYCPGVLNEDGSVTYGDTVKPIYGLMSMDLGAEGDTAKTRADGHDYIIIVSNNGYSGTLNFVMVPDEFKVDCLAEKVDEKTGMQYEDADASPAPFALMGSLKEIKKGFAGFFITALRQGRRWQAITKTTRKNRMLRSCLLQYHRCLLSLMEKKSTLCAAESRRV